MLLLFLLYCCWTGSASRIVMLLKVDPGSCGLTPLHQGSFRRGLPLNIGFRVSLGRQRQLLIPELLERRLLYFIFNSSLRPAHIVLLLLLSLGSPLYRLLPDGPVLNIQLQMHSLAAIPLVMGLGLPIF